MFCCRMGKLPRCVSTSLVRLPVRPEQRLAPELPDPASIRINDQMATVRDVRHYRRKKDRDPGTRLIGLSRVPEDVWEVLHVGLGSVAQTASSLRLRRPPSLRRGTKPSPLPFKKRSQEAVRGVSGLMPLSAPSGLDLEHLGGSSRSRDTCSRLVVSNLLPP